MRLTNKRVTNKRKLNCCFYTQNTGIFVIRKLTIIMNNKSANISIVIKNKLQEIYKSGTILQYTR